MKNKFFNFCEKFIVGGYKTKIGKKYLSTPKVAPIFWFAFITSTIGQIKDLPIVTYIGYLFIIIAVFGFFYYKIFPSRIPKGPFGK